jgi:antitoxin (DNA-binding transcriptional repressor) of toxin-antitoxin stability system
MVEVTRDEAKGQLAELIEAAWRGEEVYITGPAGQVVQLIPVRLGRGKPQFGSARGLIWMADDFDAPLDDFRDYMK